MCQNPIFQKWMDKILGTPRWSHKGTLEDLNPSSFTKTSWKHIETAYNITSTIRQDVRLVTNQYNQLILVGLRWGPDIDWHSFR